MSLFYWVLAFIGHTGVWCATFNFLHSTALVRWARKGSEILVLSILVFPVLFFVWQMFQWLVGNCELSMLTFVGQQATGTFYSIMAQLAAIPTAIFWAIRKSSPKHPESVIEFSQDQQNVESGNGDPMLHGTSARLLGLFPMNESLTLTTDRLTIQRDVPKSLDGLKLAHLSDFHLTGHIDRQFFEHAVRESNAFDPDLVIISGDLVDKRKCLDWIESVFGALKSKHGCYFVLGNHDARVGDVPDLLDRLQQVGLVHVAGKWHTLEINGANVQITGNELPWFLGAESLPLSSNEPSNKPDLKVLISHSPDQLSWAEPYGFDLMFAGHNHGGQVAFPIIGPIIAPSKYGVRYAAGTFEHGNMLMHVSRGLSAEKPIRWNSPPELGLFTIRAASESE